MNIASPISEEFKNVLEQEFNNSELRFLTNDILKLAQNSIEITLDETDTYGELGNSRIGGYPDIPTDFNWPVSNEADSKGNTKKTFLAQFNFAEITKYDPNKLLPNEGMLYFFVSGEDKPEVSLVYLPKVGDLVSGKYGYSDMMENGFRWFEEGVITKPYKIQFATKISIPKTGLEIIELERKMQSNLGIENDKFIETDQEIKDKYYSYVELYSQLCEKLNITGSSHFFGYDEDYGYSLQEEAKKNLIKKGEEGEVITFLTLESFKEVGFCFWDAGILNTYIWNQDLANRNFENIFSGLFSS